jgi:hypothetical protein
LLHRSSPPLALSTPCPCTHYTHGLSTTSPSFTFTPVFHTARHVHWYGPSRHQLASLTHTTLLVPHGLTPQPSSPRNTTTLSVTQTTAAADTTCTSQALTTHQLVPHKRTRTTVCSSQTSTATNWRNKACSSQAHPYNCLLLTDSSCNKACSSQAHEHTHIDTAQHQHNIHVSSSTSSLHNTSPQLSLSTSSSSPPNTAKPLTKLN